MGTQAGFDGEQADLHGGWLDTSITTVCSLVNLFGTRPLDMLSFHCPGPVKSVVGLQAAWDLTLQGCLSWPFCFLPQSGPSLEPSKATKGGKLHKPSPGLGFQFPSRHARTLEEMPLFLLPPPPTKATSATKGSLGFSPKVWALRMGISGQVREKGYAAIDELGFRPCLLGGICQHPCSHPFLEKLVLFLRPFGAHVQLYLQCDELRFIVLTDSESGVWAENSSNGVSASQCGTSAGRTHMAGDDSRGWVLGSPSSHV